MKNNNKASLLIYSILLTAITLILATVVMNNHMSLVISAENLEIERRFYRSIKSNINIFSKTVREINNDGGGFVDNISCPGQVNGSSLLTMSGSSKKEELKSTLFNKSGEIICISDYNNSDLEIYFNKNYDGFSIAKYNGETINLTGGPNFTGNFKIDKTVIKIPLNSYNKKDGFDDNFNNDNYQSKITP